MFGFKSRKRKFIEEWVKSNVAEMESDLTVQIAQSALPTLTTQDDLMVFYDHFRPVRKYFIMNGTVCYCNHLRNVDGEASVMIYPFKPWGKEYKLIVPFKPVLNPYTL